MYVIKNNLARHTIDVEVYHGMATSDRLDGTAVRNSDIKISRMLIEKVGDTTAHIMASTIDNRNTRSVWLLVFTAQHAAYLTSSPSRCSLV